MNRELTNSEKRIACSYCGAKTGEPCRSHPGSSTPRATPHAVRVKGRRSSNERQVNLRFPKDSDLLDRIEAILRPEESLNAWLREAAERRLASYADELSSFAAQLLSDSAPERMKR